MMKTNRTSFILEQTWTLNQYEFIDFLSNETIRCPIRSQWIHFEEYLLTILGFILTFILTIRIHFVEIRFEDYYSLFRSHLISGCLTGFFLLSFIFNTNPSEKTCRFEQIFIQFVAMILIVDLFLIGLFRRLNPFFQKCSSSTKIRWIFSIFLIGLVGQILLSAFWYVRIKRRYFLQTCFHRVQINICLHAAQPLYFSSFLLPIVLLLSANNVYRFTRPFAIAELLESIMSSIGLIMSGSMWLMNIFFSNYPQMPYRYVAYVILLTYLLPRIWISELERSRITVEEVKPLLHDQIQFQNGNCRIRFSHEDDEDEIDDDDVAQQRSKRIIRTMEMSPGEIFTSILDKHDRNATAPL